MIVRNQPMMKGFPPLKLRRRAFRGSWRLVLAVLLGLSGCSSQPKAPEKPPTAPVLRLVHHLGGTHHRSLVHKGVWFQTFSDKLLVLDPAAGSLIKEMPLGKMGETGPAVDLAIAGDRLYVVIEDDAVLIINIAEPKLPNTVMTISAAQLDLRPRRLSVIDNDVYVSGVGGVVKLPAEPELSLVFNAPMSTPARRHNGGEGAKAVPATFQMLPKLAANQEDTGRIAGTKFGLVTTVGRKVFRVDNQQYVGSASALQNVPADAGLPSEASLIFVRQDEQGALVGLMSSDVRELNAKGTTIAAAGVVRSVRAFGGRLWVVSDQQTVGYQLTDGALTAEVRCDVLGARDVAPIGDNYITIAGSQGRAIYRILDDEQGKGKTYLHSQREPSRLSRAATDGRNILAGSAEGGWMYLINARVEQTTRLLERLPPPPTLATLATGEAQVSADGQTVTIKTAAEDVTWAEPNGAIIRCAAAVDGDLWLGHDRGITVLRFDDAVQNDPVVASLRFEGPVLYIYPLLIGGGASFVSEFGGFGVAKFVEEPLQSAPGS
jgi:hypothetical protein